MSIKPALLRAESHATVGSVILRDAGIIIDRWARRAVEEQPSARRVHHDELLDHLPTFLWELGRALSDSGHTDPFRLRSANVHGDQRWQVGWSVEEVVRDYQLLRIVVCEHLDENIERSLTTRETMALSVFIDDAIAASVAAFTACQTASAPAAPGAADGRHDDLFGFLGVLGHELRNPLAPLGNALQVLKRSFGDAAVVDRARSLMDRQFKLLTRLVDDLLDLPRLRNGKLPLKPARLDLAAITRDVVGDRRGAFEAAGVALTLDAPSIPVWTSGDAGRLNQVLGNLLGNALKFTDRGGEVAVRLTRDAARQVVVLAVRDTGIGIDAVVLPTIFEPFVQADRSVERSRSGLGLGLALVRGMVELHGGTVTATSAGVSKGSEFVVELPLIDLPAETALPPATPAETVAKRRVLVIEDNQDSAESLKEYLELFGHTVATAYTGTDGIARVTSEPPDVVVCDIGLPGMSGYAVCSELRALPALAGTLFVALSGHAAEDGDTKGFDLHLLKPINPQRLAEVIAEKK